ncbi:MAG: PHP domain-containing protein [Chloroflexi bacterium]|nr:PHP domain-containing protein [Chloroflexota bacterium]
MRADLHVHTCYSRDGLTTLDGLIDRCREIGIDCVAVTDHDTIAAALELERSAPFRIIVGEEIRTTEGEIIGLFLSSEIPGGLSPRETTARIKEQGGLVCVPHPFDRLRRSPLRLSALESIIDQIDIIEVFNSRTTLLRDSEKARRFAEEHRLLACAGSDAHTPGEIGGAYVEMADFSDRDDFCRAVAQGKVVGARANPFVHVASTVAKFTKAW